MMTTGNVVPMFSDGDRVRIIPDRKKIIDPDVVGSIVSHLDDRWKEVRWDGWIKTQWRECFDLELTSDDKAISKLENEVEPLCTRGNNCPYKVVWEYTWHHHGLGLVCAIHAGYLESDRNRWQHAGCHVLCPVIGCGRLFSYKEIYTAKPFY